MDKRTSTETALQACYLLGFSPSVDRILPDDIETLEQFGVKQQDTGGVTAWFTHIDRTEFEGPVAENNLADIQWLTPRVLAHESVVSNLSQRVPFYPSRFGTLFSSTDRLMALASRSASPLAEFFSRIRGKQEWGVKFYGDNARSAEIIAQAKGILQDGKPTSGVNYLKLRQMQRAQSMESNTVFNATVTLATDALGVRYKDIISRPLHNNGKENSGEQLLRNVAVLAKRTETEELLAWANRWNEEHYVESALRIEVMGPWPPYSFCPTLLNDSEVSKTA